MGEQCKLGDAADTCRAENRYPSQFQINGVAGIGKGHGVRFVRDKCYSPGRVLAGCCGIDGLGRRRVDVGFRMARSSRAVNSPAIGWAP